MMMDANKSGFSTVLLRRVLCVCAFYFFIATLPAVSPQFVQATSAHAEGSQQDTRKTPAMRNKVYEEISKAQALVDKKQISAAKRAFKALLNRSGKRALNSYEKAMVLRALAVVEFDSNNTKSAIGNVKQLLAQPNIPLGLEQSMRYFLAQMYYSEESYKNTIKNIGIWQRLVDSPSIQSYIMLAHSHLQLKQYDSSLRNIDRAFALARQKGKPAKESWYQIRLFVYSEQENPRKQLGVLKQLVNKWPKKSYWMNMASVYGQLDRYKDQMHVLELAYGQGMLERESEFVALAQMLNSNKMPYKAAKVMEKAIKEKKVTASAKNLERLGEYWRLAQETKKALPVLAKAAKASKDGKAALRLGYLYFAQDKYQQAVNAARSALSKGGLKKPYEANLLLAQSLFYLEQYSKSKDAFKRVLKQAKPYKNKRPQEYRVAQQWLRYMESEIKRQQEIKSYINS